jgi:hypothetical protein
MGIDLLNVVKSASGEKGLAEKGQVLLDFHLLLLHGSKERDLGRHLPDFVIHDEFVDFFA